MMLSFSILSFIPNKYKSKYSELDKRTKDALKNSSLSILVKGITILCSLVLIPMTINYVNPTRYGIWLTLSGIIGWVHFFDLGLGNGFRNKFAEAKANEDIALAREYVSTTYFAISCILIVVFVVSIIINYFVNWSTILNIDNSYSEELRKVFAVVLVFVCLNMVLNLFNTLLSADQKIGYASLIGGIGQVLSVLVVFILTKVSSGSLINLAMYYSGVPTFVLFVISFYMYNFGKYKIFKPTIHNVKPKLIKNILGLGINFFVIYICLILVFQLINFALTREAGPKAVTQYNIAYKYFNVLYMLVTIIVSPYWSAFTEAYAKGDRSWMKSSVKFLEKGLMASIVVALIMLLVSDLFYRFWIGDKVYVSSQLSLALMIMTIASNFGMVYMYVINGIGAIRLQLITYAISALLSWPFMVYSIRILGVPGVVVMPTICYLSQAVLCKIQISKIINDNASGIWIK